MDRRTGRAVIELEKSSSKINHRISFMKDRQKRQADTTDDFSEAQKFRKRTENLTIFFRYVGHIFEMCFT